MVGYECQGKKLRYGGIPYTFFSRANIISHAGWLPPCPGGLLYPRLLLSVASFGWPLAARNIGLFLVKLVDAHDFVFSFFAALVDRHGWVGD